ncbi:MAG: methylmalonyl Co-A mutase-associated GTPase MeaB [Chloroflexi bacterium]|nr:methylmalonyl Co-A mutase-associated GTPase MeaB [Chloroflexota bacterium]
MQITTVDTNCLADAVLEGDRLALARLLTEVENDTAAGREALDMLFPRTGQAHIIGITGAPGAGKSSLVNQIARHYRSLPEPGKPRVAIIGVDPSSPFTGGAVLGDRVRMRDLVGDPGIFIRSMAARGALGGLAQTTAAVVQVFDAAGFSVILVETVGAGQAEVDIARLAHTTLVVEAPGMGDDIQAIKAGILEIADILVVNKADRPGADNAERILRNMLELGHPTDTLYHHPHCPEPENPFNEVDAGPGETRRPDQEVWLPPVIRTVATRGTGTPELVDAIQRHAEYLRRTGEWKSRDQNRIQTELFERLKKALVSHWRSRVDDQAYGEALTDLTERRISPYQAIQRLLEAK